MHSEAIGSVWTFSKNFEIFWIFESFFNVSGRNFTKDFFHGTIGVPTTARNLVSVHIIRCDVVRLCRARYEQHDIVGFCPHLVRLRCINS